MKHTPSAIDRYLNGTMSVQEQTQFAAQVAADPALRATLEAEQLIRSTVRGDLAAFPAEHALTRSRLMESLAAVKAPAGIAAAGGGAAAWYASGGLLKGLLGAVVVAGLSVGGYFLVQQPSSTTSQPPSPIAAPVVVAPQTTPSATPESSSVATSAATAPTPDNAAPLAKQANAAETEGITKRATEKASRSNQQSRSQNPTAATTQPATQATAVTEERALPQTTHPPAGVRQLRVVNKDSVKLKVQVKVK